MVDCNLTEIKAENGGGGGGPGGVMNGAEPVMEEPFGSRWSGDDSSMRGREEIIGKLEMECMCSICLT